MNRPAHIQRKIILPGVLLLLLVAMRPAAACGQADEIPRLRKGDFPGWQVGSIRHYAGKELYDYMDGGAEIYREYGFRHLAVQSLQKGEREILVEVYRMASPLAAFGQFSLFRRNCLPAPELGLLSCRNDFQVTFAKGPYLVSVTNYEGGPSMSQMCLAVARRLYNRIPRTDWRLPALFRAPLFRPFLDRLQFVNGPLGLQNSRPRWRDWFRGIDLFSAFLLPLRQDDCRMTCALLQFPRPGAAARFLQNMAAQPVAAGEPWRTRLLGARTVALLPLSGNRLLLIDAPAECPHLEEIQQKISSLAR